MMMEISKDQYNLLIEFAKGDIARNYFILLGLLSKNDVFDNIYGEFKGDRLVAALFKRKSGTLQFYGPNGFDIDGFIKIMKEMEVHSLIGPSSYCDVFLKEGIFSKAKDGAYISKWNRNTKLLTLEGKYSIKELKVGDLDRVVFLYKDVFHSHTPKEVMEEKLISGRGRGYYIEENGEILSLVQSEFENEDAAIIVGVATSVNYRNKGLATELLKHLINELQAEGKDLYLQYDNLDAGIIYERLGFTIIDQVKHFRV